MTITNGHNQKNVLGALEMDLARPRKADDVEQLVEHMLVQCRALVRQQMERKARQEPLVYNLGLVDETMQQFDASADDIRRVILDRVQTRVRSFVQSEILRVLQDAVSASLISRQSPVIELNTSEELSPGEPGPSLLGGFRPARPTNGAGPGPRTMGEGRLPENRTTEGLRRQPPTAMPSSEDARQERTSAPPQEVIFPVPPEEKRPTLRQPSPATNGANGASAVPTQPSNDGVVGGKVRLHVQANDSIQQVIHFVDALRRRSELRVLQVVGSYNQGVSIWLVLRVPLPLKQVLLGMGLVSQVDGSEEPSAEGVEPVITVCLGEALSPN